MFNPAYQPHAEKILTAKVGYKEMVAFKSEIGMQWQLIYTGKIMAPDLGEMTIDAYCDIQGCTTTTEAERVESVEELLEVFGGEVTVFNQHSEKMLDWDEFGEEKAA